VTDHVEYKIKRILKNKKLRKKRKEYLVN
jgi:hypothetical protein